MNPTLVIGSFVTFLLAFTLIGIVSSIKKKDSPEDYLVASRSVNPWLTALSAVSTNNSGYMFIGLIGFTWRSGFEAVWITFGWVLGDLLTWFWVHKRVRARSEAVSANSVPALLAKDDEGKVARPIAVIAGILTLFFLGGYAAAQLKAGSATLNALFDWPLWLGAVIGVVVVVLYCFAGGIRASIWTDAAQSVVMMGAMFLLAITCATEVGGPSELIAALEKIDPGLIDSQPAGLLFGPVIGLALYVLGFIFAGVGTIGQPHILVRFMAIDATSSVNKARNIYIVFYLVFSLGAFVVGLYARVLLPDLAAGLEGSAVTTASESALPTLAVKMLPSIPIGIMLAGIFSATMSTADSQILSCSAAITQDVFPGRWSKSTRASKAATLFVAGLALLIALTASAGVFSLVLLAWSALAASIGPVLIVRLAKQPLPSWLAIVMMCSGLITIWLWGESSLGDAIYKALPGMLVPGAIYVVARLLKLAK